MSEKKEYIERGALLLALGEKRAVLNGLSEYGYLQVIREVPAADVEPVVREHWEWFCEVDSTTNGYEEDYGWRCSGCHAKLTDFIADGDVYDEYPVRMRYCPNCGAHMERSGSGE